MMGSVTTLTIAGFIITPRTIGARVVLTPEQLKVYRQPDLEPFSSPPRDNKPARPNTKPVPDLPPDTPVVRDPDGFVYFRENEGRFLAGGFEPKAKPAYMDDELPEKRAELTEDWDHFHLLLENLLHRFAFI